MIVTAIEEIAWLLNIRGYDNEFSPYLRAYVILTKDKIHLFADEQSLTPAVHRNLHTSHCVNAFCVRYHLEIKFVKGNGDANETIVRDTIILTSKSLKLHNS